MESDKTGIRRNSENALTVKSLDLHSEFKLFTEIYIVAVTLPELFAKLLISEYVSFSLGKQPGVENREIFLPEYIPRL